MCTRALKIGKKFNVTYIMYGVESNRCLDYLREKLNTVYDDAQYCERGKRIFLSVVPDFIIVFFYFDISTTISLIGWRIFSSWRFFGSIPTRLKFLVFPVECCRFLAYEIFYFEQDKYGKSLFYNRRESCFCSFVRNLLYCFFACAYCLIVFGNGFSIVFNDINLWFMIEIFEWCLKHMLCISYLTWIIKIKNEF